MKQKALFMVLSDKIKTGNIVILDKIELKEFKTKTVEGIITKLEKKAIENKEEKKAKRSILVIDADRDEKLKFSTRNLEGVSIINLDNINILDLLKYRNLFITKAGVEKIQGNSNDTTDK